MGSPTSRPALRGPFFFAEARRTHGATIHGGRCSRKSGKGTKQDPAGEGNVARSRAASRLRCWVQIENLLLGERDQPIAVVDHRFAGMPLNSSASATGK